MPAGRRGDDHELGGGSRQHQGNRKMHEQRMKFAEERHKRLMFEVPRQGSPCFVYRDRGGGGYIPRVVPLWSWNKPAGDWSLGPRSSAIRGDPHWLAQQDSSGGRRITPCA